MRSSGWVTRGLAALILTVCVQTAARAEAPFFYDPISQHTLYDPEFYPLNRSAGLLSLFVQGWTVPSAGDPEEGVFDQDIEPQYRFRWTASLDPAYSLLVELKGDDRDGVIEDDYFLRSEFLYQGLEAPIFLYTGIRLPEDGDFVFYGGVESMSYRVSDLLKGGNDLPLAFRGFAEVRTLVEGDGDPVLRLMPMAHTLPDFAVENLILTTGVDMRFSEVDRPQWLLDVHAEYRLQSGFLRWGLVAGYQYDLVDEIQRASVGIQAELF